MLKVSESKEIVSVALCVRVFLHALKCLCVHVRVWAPEVDTGTFLCHSLLPLVLGLQAHNHHAQFVTQALMLTWKALYQLRCISSLYNPFYE